MLVMKKITDDLIHKVSESMWEEALGRHGSHTAIPMSETFVISETLRALYVLQIWQRDGAQGNPAKFLRTYAVTDSMVDGIVAQYVGKAVEEAPTEKRSARWDAFNKWIREHSGEQFTTDQLVEQSGFSYPTTLKYVQESPLFVKIKKGLWKVAETQKNSV